MKVKPDTLNMMVDNIRNYLTARFPSVLEDIKNKKGDIKTFEMWTIWHHICDEKRFDDSHPRFNNRKRVLDFDWHFSLYPDNTNDVTLETALKKVFKLL